MPFCGTWRQGRSHQWIEHNGGGWGGTRHTSRWWLERQGEREREERRWRWREMGHSKIKIATPDEAEEPSLEHVVPGTDWTPAYIAWHVQHMHTFTAPIRFLLVVHKHNHHHKYKLAIVAAGGGRTEIEADWLIWRLNSKWCCFYSPLKFTDWILCSQARTLKFVVWWDIIISHYMNFLCHLSAPCFEAH